MNIYVATPIDGLNEQQRETLRDDVFEFVENEYGYDSVYFPLAHYEVQSKMIEGGQTSLVFEEDIRQLNMAELLLVIQPQLSKGAHFEVGYIYGVNRARTIAGLSTTDIRILSCDCYYGQMSLMLHPFKKEHFHHRLPGGDFCRGK